MNRVTQQKTYTDLVKPPRAFRSHAILIILLGKYGFFSVGAGEKVNCDGGGNSIKIESKFR